MGVIAHRPALLQVNYLGFPGTLGAEYMDYILADAEVIPPGDEQFYSEKVVRLPAPIRSTTARAPGLRRARALRMASRKQISSSAISTIHTRSRQRCSRSG